MTNEEKLDELYEDKKKLELENNLGMGSMLTGGGDFSSMITKFVDDELLTHLKVHAIDAEIDELYEKVQLEKKLDEMEL